MEKEEWYEDYEEYDKKEKIYLSVKYRRAINRIFREYSGINKIPHPEVDNLYQRIRSAIIVKFHLKPYDPKASKKRRRITDRPT